jgi:glycosyltransferase involved in cell wall biosynthesis
MKLTHYVDEFIAAAKLRRELEKADMILVFGSMSLFSFFLRSLGVKKTIVYDPLSNYSQTLYLRSRRSLLELLKYGLYLSLHKLEIKSSDIVVYPSKIDLENAVRMFKPKKTVVIPNPPPICYESVEEYVRLRAKRINFDKPYFILLAGVRGKGNEEAVKAAIDVFNALPPERFKLFITGPWQDMKKYVKNPSIKLLGIVPKEQLKELLAISDYGLSPIFSHCAGTFLKVISYISAKLDIIASPYSIFGVELQKGVNVYLVRNVQEFAVIVKRIISSDVSHRKIKGERNITVCGELSIGASNMIAEQE